MAARSSSPATLTNLVPDDTNGLGDTFVYDRPSNTIKLVSAASNGTQGDGDSTLASDISHGGSFQGAFAAFGSTAGNLVTPNDTDGGLSDVFVVDRTGGIFGAVMEDDTTPAFALAPAGSLSTHGAFNFSDVDLTDTHTILPVGNPVITNAPPGFFVPASGLGTFTPAIVETSGTGHGQLEWTFAVDNALVQALNGGQQINQVYTVQIDDGHGGVVTQDVTIVIFGTPDTAVVSGTMSSTVVEASGVSNTTPGTSPVSGTLTDTDVDNPPNTFQAVAAGAPTNFHYGTFEMTVGGTWTYTLNENNAAVQALNVGSVPLTDTFVVHTQDGTPQLVTITINGANDAAVVSGTSTGTVIEAGGLNNGTPGTPTASETLTDTDVDNTPNTFQAVAAGASTDNHYGTYAMTAGGTWTYTLNNDNAAVQALTVGSVPLTDTFTVYTQDDTAQLVTVTIDGTNDVPVINHGTAVPTAG